MRTSHIVYPDNGQLPELVTGAIARQGVYGGATTGETRPVRIAAGGIGTDGPEDRGLSERCIIGFNAGPPLYPQSLQQQRADLSVKRHSSPDDRDDTRRPYRASV